MKKLLIPILVLSNLVTLGLVYVQTNKVNTLVAAEQARAATPVTKTLTLPPDAVKVSECVPFMGEHYVVPSQLPRGPMYTAYKGKITGIEFMFKENEIAGEKLAKMSAKESKNYIMKNHMSLSDIVQETRGLKIDLMGLQYKSMEIGWSVPHAGFPEPHLDVHAFLVEPEEVESICPDAQLQDAYSPEVINNVQKYKIPFPGELPPAN